MLIVTTQDAHENFDDELYSPEGDERVMPYRRSDDIYYYRFQSGIKCKEYFEGTLCMSSEGYTCGKKYEWYIPDELCPTEKQQKCIEKNKNLLMHRLGFLDCDFITKNSCTKVISKMCEYVNNYKENSATVDDDFNIGMYDSLLDLDYWGDH